MLLPSKLVARLAGFILLASCGGGGTTTPEPSPPPPPPPPAAVATVSVDPSAATVSLDQSTQLTATPRDASGNALTGRAVVWSSSNPTIATISGDGLVTGRAIGTATMSATSEGVSGTATVVVNAVVGGPVARVVVLPDAPLLPVGASIALRVLLVDAQNNILSGRSVGWISSDVAVAGVSQSAVVSANSPGTALITATSEGRAATTTVRVIPPETVGRFSTLVAGHSTACGLNLAGLLFCWGGGYPGTDLRSLRRRSQSRSAPEPPGRP